MKIAVIGLGVVGASVARSLALAGAQVTVLERSSPGAGTSGTTFAWINSHLKEPLAYHHLNAAGVAEHKALTALPAPGPAWYFPTGNLQWALDDCEAERLASTCQRLVGRGYRVDWLTREGARAIEPDLRLPDAVTAVASFPDEGHVHPMTLIARLWGEAHDLGAQLRCPANIKTIDEACTGVRLTLDDGTTETADVAVLAVGRWSEQVGQLAGIELPMADPTAAGSPTVGLLGYTQPLPTRLRGVLTSPRLNVRPEGGGRLLVQALALDADADPAAPPPVDGPHAHELCARLTELLEGTTGARLDALRVGQRALPADGLSAAGFARRCIYTLVTHSGVTLGPLLGRLAAEEIVLGRQSELFTDFRPTRFAGPDRDEIATPAAARLPGQQ